jgi:hypothetical protein
MLIMAPLLVTPNREFERQFGGKTVLLDLRLKKQYNILAATGKFLPIQFSILPCQKTAENIM